ncbi:RNA polymerase II elongation factor ELL2 [Anabarilius grahami]|uniref:RNA polymerase II elongation factor ELL2 n=1 Tax=Anabarilius grahami TaxID=495550 RepID=A0A3N0YAF8_ANAGA|nr:RNA polymerase II elongation factor ELL2 [Anabarilius grahami]
MTFGRECRQFTSVPDMAALRQEHRYGLSCGKINKSNPNKTIFHVKLTDTAIRTLEAYQNLKTFKRLDAVPMSSLIGRSGGVECRLTQSEHEKTSSSLQQELDNECSIGSLPNQPAICFKGNQGARRKHTHLIQKRDRKWTQQTADCVTRLRSEARERLLNTPELFARLLGQTGDWKGFVKSSRKRPLTGSVEKSGSALLRIVSCHFPLS